ncbi:PhoH family protein, partial [Vibrio parahaemolyticus]|uniref:PhoH family protein n=1 Tax=Vibrio parahaemolyticus TaxID=670 RepID=UPI00358E1A67
MEFNSTSHEQGLTYKNAVIVCDEIQNYNFKELDMMTTRRGKNCKMVAVGDFVQDYVTSRKEKSGLS